MTDHDPAAVEAANVIFPLPVNVPPDSDLPGGPSHRKFARKQAGKNRDRAACIITDAYRPRLTAERKVRKKLVLTLRHQVKCYCSKERDDENQPVYVCARCTALAVAEKLSQT